MTNDSPRVPSGNVLELSVFADVWAIELNDIDDRLAGNDPDSFKTWIGGVGKKVETKLGVDKNQFGVVGMIPGVGGLALAVGTIGLGMDAIKDFDTIKKSNQTERLLALRKIALDSVNWDTVQTLITHVQSWLLPRLNERFTVLASVLEASQGDQLVQDRFHLYESAIAEIKVALDALQKRERVLQTEWDIGFKAYREASAKVQKVYEEAKRGVELAAQALLLDRAAATAKLEVIDSEYTRLQCANSSFFTRCESLHVEGSVYCPEHTCFERGCSGNVAKKSRYCEKHSNQLADVSASLPKHLKSAGLTPKKASEVQPKTEGINTQRIIFSIILCLAGYFVYKATSTDHDIKDTKIAVAAVPAPQAEPISKMGPSQELFLEPDSQVEQMGAADLELLRSKVYGLYNESRNKYEALNAKVQNSLPNLKSTDRNFIVSSAREMLTGMEDILSENRREVALMARAIYIHELIAKNPLKLPVGKSEQENLDKLVERQKDLVGLRQETSQIEISIAGARSSFRDMVDRQ